ncbi:MAG: hypothetical protein N3G21_12240 [Candidatus Hydrogenedentes bacterium]|nr:hypothetical protein [Candidatus Hydrogenedentota bacterium]
MRVLKLVSIVLLICLLDNIGFPAETDQYLSWGIELKDSAEVLNRYFNEELERYIELVNSRTKPIKNPEELTIAIYYHFFQFLGWSRLRVYIRHSPEIEKYPDLSVPTRRYQRMSIHRGFAFPYILPMARTIRVGDIYFGIDKLCHFFGFGRRYYQRYCRHIKEGYSEEDAMRKVVLWGIFHEENLVGKLVDGIFSHGDLEANFQGFRLARDLCGGNPPYIENINGKWRLVRKIDFRNYITPGFDESYNNSHFWAMRKRTVLKILKDEYCDKVDLPAVKKRFEIYKNYPPSFSQKIIKEYFEKKGKDPQQEQSVWALCRKNRGNGENICNCEKSKLNNNSHT